MTLVYASSLYLQLDRVNVGEIERSWTGKNVEITGSVADFSTSGSTAFIDVKDSTGEILVVNFDNKLELEEGQNVTVIGYVSIYRGTLEVIAKEIESG